MRQVVQPMFEELVRIGQNLCREDQRELAETRDITNFYALAADAWVSPFKRVVLDDGEPVFAFGANPVDEVAQVWGFKTPAGQRSARLVTAYIQKTMIPELRARGVRRAVCLVHRANTTSQRWLAHLGFQPKATHREFGTLVLYQRDEPDA